MLKLKQNKGFSLLELSIVLSIMTVLSAVSFPYWEEMAASYRHNTATGLLTSDLRLTRFEAVKNNAQTRIRIVSSSSYIMEKKSGSSWDAMRPVVNFTEKVQTKGATMLTGVDPAMFYPSGSADGSVTFQVSYADQATKFITVSLSGMVKRH
jgi:prepilin-type N-terminal cleavage/methylation domain-containing protein